MTSNLDASQTEFSDCLDIPFPLPSARKIGPVVTVMNRSAWKNMREHGDSNANREICGVLVGELGKDEDGAFLHIRDLIRGEHAEGGRGQVTFTAETWRHIQLQLEEHPRTWRILGWYHTHPGFGIFLSNMDVFIHSNFFNLPWQVAYVYDPQSKEEGLFAWSEGEPKKFGFLMLEDKASESASAGCGKDNSWPDRVAEVEREVRGLRLRVLLVLGLSIMVCILALTALVFTARKAHPATADESGSNNYERCLVLPECDATTSDPDLPKSALQRSDRALQIPQNKREGE